MPCEIQEIKPKLFTSIALSPSGVPIYLAFERVTPDNYSFWYQYNQNTAKHVRQVLRGFAPHYRRAILRDHNLQHQVRNFECELACEFRHYRDLPIPDYTRLNQILSREGVPAGITGLNAVFTQLENSGDEKQVYIVYASKTPIKGYANEHFGPAFQPGYSEAFLHYKRYKNLLMQFSVTTADSSISVTHMGIYRNPMLHLEPRGRYGSISTILHGFAAECALSRLNKKIQVNKPTQAMHDILSRCIGVEQILKPPMKYEEQTLAVLNHVEVHGILLGVSLDDLAKPFLLAHEKLLKPILFLQTAFRKKQRKHPNEQMQPKLGKHY